jgi:hypothetical protein
MAYSYIALVVTGFRFLLPYFPQNRAVPLLVFVALPVGSWIGIERRLVPHWRARFAPKPVVRNIV